MFVDVLELYFDDSSENESIDFVHGKMNVDHYFKIKDFINKYKNGNEVRTLIVSCDAGQGRSPAIALGVADYLLDDADKAIELIEKNGHWKPNSHVLSFFRKDFYNQI